MLFGVRQILQQNNHKIEYSLVRTVDCSPFTSIDIVKSVIETLFDIPKNVQLLYYNGTLLLDTNNVAHYEIQSDSIITLVDARAIMIQ